MDNYSTPKKMKKVGDLFEKYKKQIKPPQATIEKAFVEAVFESTSLKIDVGKVSYKTGTKTIGLNLPSLLKTELCLKQTDILRRTKEKVGKEDCPNVIV